MLLGIWRQVVTAFVHRPADPDGSHRVLKWLARAHMHDDLTQRYHGYLQVARDELDRATVNVVHGALVKHQTYPGPASEGIVQPFDLRGKGILVGWKIRYENGKAIWHPTQVPILLLGAGEVLRRQAIFALGCPGAGERNQFRQVSVSLAVLGEQD